MCRRFMKGWLGESYINTFIDIFGCVYSSPLTLKWLGFLKHKPSGINFADFGRKSENLFCENFKMVRSPKNYSCKFFVFFKGKISIDKICFKKLFLFFLAYINLFYIYSHLIVLEKEKPFFKKA